MDPLLHTVPPKDQPERVAEAEQKNEAQCEFWDLLTGRTEPELGGRSGYLDVVGVNYYPDMQTELGSEQQLPLDDPRRKPFREMLKEVYARYRRSLVVAQTSARGRERSPFLRETVEECLAAMREGVDLRGSCLYPLVDMPEWKHGRAEPLGHLGLWDVVRQGETVQRVVNHAYLAEFQRAQERVRAEFPLLAAADPNRAATESADPAKGVNSMTHLSVSRDMVSCEEAKGRVPSAVGVRR